MPTPATNSAVATSPAAARPTNVPNYAVIFPGQGSQRVGMLADWAAVYPQVRATFEQASDALDFDVWALCQGTWQDAAGQGLDATAYTQPALLTASMAIWRVLDSQIWQHAPERRPQYVAGHSLGEYSALCAAGVLDFAEAVRLVHQRGQLMQHAMQRPSVGELRQNEQGEQGAPAQTGAMLAVLGAEDAIVAALCQSVQDNTPNAIVTPANYNAPGQVVIAGTATGVDAVRARLGEIGAKGVLLKVSVPSHCPLMQPAADELAALIAGIALQPPRMAVVQNRHARIEPDLAAIQQALVEQLSCPVLWASTQTYLAQAGVTLQIECGSGNVLTNLAKRQTPSIPTLATDPVSKLDAVQTALDELLNA